MKREAYRRLTFEATKELNALPTAQFPYAHRRVLKLQLKLQWGRREGKRRTEGQSEAENKARKKGLI